MQKTGWRGWGCEILVGVYIVSFGREGGVWGVFCLVLGVGFFLLSFVFKNKKHIQFFLASVLSIQVTITEEFSVPQHYLLQHHLEKYRLSINLSMVSYLV